ncbi:MAG: hypothetical protein KDA21_08570 [Phycisphaerales bacterium]|nr:hypothetical protein [Phycisphaerales bacterium]
MATRTSASVGMMVTLAIFALLTLALFVLTIVFFARTTRLQADMAAAQLEYETAIRPSERNDRWLELQRLAQDEGMGVVAYLDGQIDDLKKMAAGTARVSLATVAEQKAELLGPDAGSYYDSVRDLNQRNERLRSELKSAQEALDAANIDLQAEVERVQNIEDEHTRTVQGLNDQINNYKSQIDGYREELASAKRQMDDRVGNIRGDLEDRISDLETTLNSTDAKLRIAEAQLKELRAAKANETLRAEFEGALVDAHVIGINAPANEIYIDRGRNDRVVLGMTFEVYDDAGSIRVNPETGNYPQGKSTVEVIRLSDSSSTARILRERRGNPIVNTDVLANAIYDPNKTYAFAVYGNFDTNGDGIHTRQEAQDIKGLIESWGGRVMDDVSGNTDFLVLGVKPLLPPEPKSGDPIEVIRNYLDLSQDAARYDTLFNTAGQTGIPVLNQNRLYTLTGLHARR